ncbi:MAG: hypothetical protein LBF86_06865 [Helicobacteraceae bacterium]|jgi:hypothetical protein|nr:hypothetical protein [Helicobacteraceae bacterium]
MANNRPRNIDVTKATLFTLFIFFTILALIYFFFVPDVRRLKLVTMSKSRSDISLQQIKAELKLRESNLEGTKLEHNDRLKALANDFPIDDFHKEASRFFSKFDLTPVKINSDSPPKSLRVNIYEYNVGAELREPSDFYDFVEFINNYRNAIELTLPITIKADQNNRLSWDFGLKVYRSSADRSER